MKWHDIRKEKPEIDEVVLVYGKLKDGDILITKAWLHKGRDGFMNYNCDELIWGNAECITHWCYLKDIPLPKDK